MVALPFPFVTPLMANLRLLLALALVPAALEPVFATGSAAPPRTDSPPKSLRAAAAAKGMLFGSAVKASAIKDDAVYRELIVREFSIVTAENELKMAATQPAEGRFDFAKADLVVDFATRHGLEIRGHTLCWDADRYLPKWVLERTFTREEATHLLRTHIHTVMSRYRGRIKYWDVVNEAVANIKSVDTPLLVHEFWSKHLGDDYIALAFRFAHEADPDAVLFYNDYDHGKSLSPKSNRIYDLLKRLVQAGVPIHGVGLQMHCNLTQPPNYEAMKTNFERLGRLGLRVQITELDVYPMGVPGTLEERLARQAAVYHDVVAAAVDSKVCEAIVMWGFTDKFNQRGINQRKNLPLEAPTLLWLFDEHFQPKPAYFGVMRAFLRP